MADEPENVGYYKAFPTRTKEWVDTYVVPHAEELGADLTVAEAEPEWAPVFLPPDLWMGDRSGKSRARADIDSMKDFLDDFDILEVNKFIGKDYGEHGYVVKGGKIFIRCPDPLHNDANPSAHVTEDEKGGVYYCFPCARGGDKYTLAAASGFFGHYHLDSLGRRGSREFADISRKLAEQLGWEPPVMPDEPEVEADEPPKEVASTEATSDPRGDGASSALAEVVEIRPPETDSGFAAIDDIRIDWRAFFPDGTFAHEFMTQTSRLDIPEEYFFWEALQMIGLACGRKVYMNEIPNIYPNLYLTIKGTTGSGKSRSINIMKSVLLKALPYDSADPRSQGVFQAGSPGSGEAILFAYGKDMPDPASPGTTTRPVGLRALWTIDELSALMARGARNNSSTIVPTLIELYDSPDQMTHRLRSGDIVADEPYGCVISGTQPKAMQNFLSKNDVHNGFLNRWVFVEGVPKRAFAVQTVAVDLDPAADLLRAIGGWANAGRVVKFTPGGLKAWTDLFDSELAHYRNDEDASILGRLDLNLKKVMMVMAANERKTEVNETIIARIKALIPYMLATYDATVSSISLSTKDRLVEKLEQFLSEKPLKHGELMKKCRRAGFEFEIVSQVVTQLERMGLVAIQEYRPATGKKGGRPTVMYVWKAEA